MFPYHRRDHDDNLRFHTIRITSELWCASYLQYVVLSMSVMVFEANLDGSVPSNDAHFISKFRNSRVPLQESIPPLRTGA
jgi:hypothetical protein